MKRIKCTWCGKAVSSPVPDDVVIRAVIECPECVLKRKANNPPGDINERKDDEGSSGFCKQ